MRPSSRQTHSLLNYRNNFSRTYHLASLLCYFAIIFLLSCWIFFKVAGIVLGNYIVISLITNPDFLRFVSVRGPRIRIRFVAWSHVLTHLVGRFQTHNFFSGRCCECNWTTSPSERSKRWKESR
jgi:hypothetical protein